MSQLAAVAVLLIGPCIRSVRFEAAVSAWCRSGLGLTVEAAFRGCRLCRSGEGTCLLRLVAESWFARLSAWLGFTLDPVGWSVSSYCRTATAYVAWMGYLASLAAQSSVMSAMLIRHT